MTIALRALGAGAGGLSGTVQILEPTGAGASTSDVIIGFVGAKPSTATQAHPSWTSLGSSTNGVVAAANDVGSMVSEAFVRRTSSLSYSSDSFENAAHSSNIGRAIRFSRSAGNSWAVTAYHLADSDETLTAVSATTNIPAGEIAAGDWIAIAVNVQSDALTHSAMSLTISGVTLGTITWSAPFQTSLGTDTGQYIGYAQVTAGASDGGAMLYTATASVSGKSGTAISVVRVRESATAAPAATLAQFHSMGAMGNHSSSTDVLPLASVAGTGAQGVAASTEDILLDAVIHKPYNYVLPTTDHSLVAEAASGTVAPGVGLGSIKSSVLRRVSVTTSAATINLALPNNSNQVGMGRTFRFSKPAGKLWDVAGFGLADIDETGTAVSATGSGAVAAIAAGDVLLLSVAIRDDGPQHSSRALAVAGCTLGDPSWQLSYTTSIEGQARMYTAIVEVLSGSSTGALTYTAVTSQSGTSATAVAVARIRAVDQLPFVGWGVRLR